MNPIIPFEGPYINALPEIKVTYLTEYDEFIIMGTDGLWDEMTSREIAEILENMSDKPIKDISTKIIWTEMTKVAQKFNVPLMQLMNFPPGRQKKSSA